MRKHISATLRMLDEGATVPFIARYRKEATGSLDEVTVQKIKLRYDELKEFFKRRDFIIDAIRAQGALTPELEARIEGTFDPIALEDIYLPYKPKRCTRAAAAIENGLEPLARQIMAQNLGDITKVSLKYINDNVLTSDAAISGAMDIIGEWVSESEKARNIVRAKFGRSAIVKCKVAKGKEAEGENYQNYFDFSEPMRTCTSHRYLAMCRGENEGILNVSICIDDNEMIDRLCRMFVKPEATEACAVCVKAAVKDGYKRLLRPSIESEMASQLKNRSDESAISLFADNLRQLLLAAPLGKKRIMAIDPGFKSGCKVVDLDEQGNLLGHEVVYPNAPANDFYGAADTLCAMVAHDSIDAIALGNGTASRDTEKFLESIRFPRNVEIHVVSEQGASIYSASEVAREEFPDEDITVRGAVSIGRRLLDPLAELVKIDPKSIGVGQYQHDVNQTKLKEALDYTVESCVNSVGVNVNTASRQLLSYVSGIGPALASYIVEYRKQHGNFSNRQELLNVPRMGEKAFQQCAGFLRIPGGDNPLDNTGVHPERYALVETIAKASNCDVKRLMTDRNFLHNIDIEQFATKDVGMPTLTDLVKELEKPGRDPRVGSDKVEFDDAVKKIDDLHIGQELTGKVNNITAFGVFVDLGLKENGLIHISQLSDKYITSPNEVVRMGQVLKVRVIDVDASRGRIALTLKGVTQGIQPSW